MPSAVVIEEDHYRAHRDHLWGLCYRMTGSAADADELVQETFARAIERPPPDTDRPWRPWLTRVAMNLARDRLRRRARQSYTGPWLPTPVEVPPDAWVEGPEDPERRYDRRESATLAFLVALEALTPAQRAVLLLRDVYERSVRETAALLELGESNVKVLHHRARKAMEAYDAARVTPDEDTRRRALDALQRFAALAIAGDADGLRAMLTEDAEAVTDGGGEFLAALKPIRGADRVARFLAGIGEGDTPERLDVLELNGLPAILVERDSANPRIARRSVTQVDMDAGGRIRHIWTILAPAKLGGLS